MDTTTNEATPVATKPVEAPAKPAKAKAKGKATTARKTKTAGKPEAKQDGRLVLKSICSKLKIEPKAARRKLRKAKLSFHVLRERWTMTPKQAQQVEDILRAKAA